MKRQLKKARADEAWDDWQEAAEALIELGEELELGDCDRLSVLTDPDGPETYCVDEDWLYFGPGGCAWQ